MTEYRRHAAMCVLEVRNNYLKWVAQGLFVDDGASYMYIATLLLVIPLLPTTTSLKLTSQKPNRPVYIFRDRSKGTICLGICIEAKSSSMASVSSAQLLI